jgi:hypothetical protein
MMWTIRAPKPGSYCRCFYCKIVVSVQLGDVFVAVPLALKRMTPDGSPQKQRCPVVPIVIGVATTM